VGLTTELERGVMSCKGLTSAVLLICHPEIVAEYWETQKFCFIVTIGVPEAY
jgi:hypothetical protein